MKGRLCFERPKSQYSKRSFVSDLKQAKLSKRHAIQQQQVSSQLCQDDLDSFFNNFHDTFIVFDNPLTVKKVQNDRKTPFLDQVIRKQTSDLNRKNPKPNKKVFAMNLNSKKGKQNEIKKNLNIKQRSCISEIKRSKNCDGLSLKIHKKKTSSRKTQQFSRKKQESHKSKKSTIKKHIARTGSTATTLLENSTIRLKEDIHAASYLRLKIKLH